MYDYLIEHAVANVWCTPEQDLQLILQPARLTPINGHVRHMKIGWEIVDLPDSTNYYHVYQIGQLHPSIYGVLKTYNDWTTLKTLCNDEKMIINIYTANGRQMARFESYFKLTLDGNVLLAVREQLPINDLNNDHLFVRFYSNAFYETARSDNNTEIVKTNGCRVKTLNDITLIQKEVRDWRKVGTVDAFVNGVMVNEPSVYTAKVGDLIEYLYDSSVYKTYDLSIYGANGSTFNSTLDSKVKTLLMPEVTPDNWIDYADDVDIYLIYPSGAELKGFYFHKNHEYYFRNITHKDYSIDNLQIEAIRALNTGIVPLTSVPKIRLRIKQGGYRRALTNEHHRIKELYKLPYAKIRKALIGTESLVPEWRAAALEASEYCKLMASKDGTIDITTVQNAYGYNAVTKLVCDSPIKVVLENNIRKVNLPKECQVNATIFEYDINGLLIDFYTHVSGDTWVPKNGTCTMVETWPSLASHALDISYGLDSVTIDPINSYRFYRCPIENGLPTWAWEDITDTQLYINANNTITWAFNTTLYYTAIKSDARALVYRYSMKPLDGLIKFNVTNDELHYGATGLRPLYIAPGMLELWMNGRSLIEDIDYFVQWPEIVVCNKRYLNADTAQNFIVKCTGFADAAGVREKPTDVGYVQYHTLSRNNKFDIRDDKPLNIVVGGARYLRSELTFAEDELAAKIDDEVNGTPYAVYDTPIPLRRIISVDTMAFRRRSRTVDQAISNYMSTRVFERTKTTPNIIPDFYEVYSPFTWKIIRDLQRGALGGARIRERYTEDDIADLLSGYIYLLNYEPSRNGIDTEYVKIHPTPLYALTELDIYQYTFTERAIKMYLDNAVDLTSFVKIGLPK